MPRLEIYSQLHNSVTFEVKDMGQYTAFKVFFRKTNSSNAVTEYVYSSYPYITFDGLEENTSYTYNMQYGTTEANCTTYWYTSNAPTFTTGILLTLELTNITSITISFYRPNGYYDTITLNGSDGSTSKFEEPVRASQDCYVHSINSGDRYPVMATGDGAPFTVMDENGDWIDHYLSIGIYSKSFAIYVHGGSSGSNDGLVWINGHWYQPYIYNNGWKKVVPYVYNDVWKRVGK